MPRTMKAAEFKAKCLEAVAEVVRTREPITVTKHGKAVAQLVPVIRKRVRNPKTLLGFLKGKIQSHGDIISPIDVVWNADR